MRNDAKENLSRLFYVSRNTISGNQKAYRDEINRILAVAQRRNAAMGITGLLTFSQGFFAQVLEGNPADIDELFEAIQMDRRHDDVTILEVTPVEKRAFASWAMGFLGEDPELEGLFRGMRARDSVVFDEKDAARIFGCMEMLAKRQKVALMAA